MLWVLGRTIIELFLRNEVARSIRIGPKMDARTTFWGDERTMNACVAKGRNVVLAKSVTNDMPRTDGELCFRAFQTSWDAMGISLNESINVLVAVHAVATYPSLHATSSVSLRGMSLPQYHHPEQEQASDLRIYFCLEIFRHFRVYSEDKMQRSGSGPRKFSAAAILTRKFGEKLREKRIRARKTNCP